MEYFSLSNQLYPINDDLYYEKVTVGPYVKLHIGYTTSRNLPTVSIMDITNQSMTMQLDKIVEFVYPQISKVTIPKLKPTVLAPKPKRRWLPWS